VLEQRCNGYASILKAHGGSSVFLSLPSGDSSSPEKVQQDIAGALAAHPGVNGIFTLGAPEAVSAVAAVQQVGKAGKVTIGTTDLSNADLQAVKTGALQFVLDQQPFLQGYYGLQAAYQYLKYRVAPIGQVTIGPFLIDKADVGTG